MNNRLEMPLSTDIDATMKRSSKTMLVFQTRSGLMAGKFRLRWVGPYWIINGKDSTYNLGTLNGEKLAQLVNCSRSKAYYGKMLPNPFLKDLQMDAEDHHYILSEYK